MVFPFADIPPGTSVYKFDTLIEAKAVSRPNRFLVTADVSGTVENCHLHDPGRLKELIFPGNDLLVRESKGKKTGYRVVAANRKGKWILIDSGIHSAIAGKFLSPGFSSEVRLKNRRLDFAWISGQGNVFLEVKGCTLTNGHIALFPDAPTERGASQVQLLSEHQEHGGRAFILVLVFSDEAECFASNTETDPVFAAAMQRFIDTGGKIEIRKITFRGNELVYRGNIPLCGGSNA